MRILFFLVALTAVMLTAVAQAADQKATPALSGHQLDQAVHDALRHWAKPSEDQLEPAARELLNLYGDLQRDTALAKSTRARLTSKVRGRLADLAEKLGRRVAKDRADAQRPKSVDRAGKDNALAQLAGPPGAGRAESRRTQPSPRSIAP